MTLGDNPQFSETDIKIIKNCVAYSQYGLPNGERLTGHYILLTLAKLVKRDYFRHRIQMEEKGEKALPFDLWFHYTYAPTPEDDN